MAADDVYAGYIEMAVRGQSFKLTLTVLETSTGTGAGTAVLAADAAKADLQAELAAIFAADVQLGCIYLRKDAPDGQPPGLAVFNSVPGSRPIPAMSFNSTAILNLIATTLGANHAGMWQISGISKTDWVNGHLDATFVTTQVGALITKLAAEFTDGSANTYRYAIRKRWEDTILLPFPITEPIDIANINTAARSRRTRVSPLTGTQ